MGRKIIALVDASDYAASVCGYAAWIARGTQSPIELIHVLGTRSAPESQDLSGSIRLGARSALLHELAELDAQRAKLAGQHGRAILEDARGLIEEAGVKEITTRLRHGGVVESIGDIEGDARVIVIGKRGEEADMARGHVGSNLERIVRAAHKPIFVASRSFRPINRVLVAFDGGASSQEAVRHIARSPLFVGLPIHLVTVGNDTAGMSADLEKAVAVLTEAGLEAQARILPGQPEAVLSDLVSGEGFDLIVMGAYGHSRIRTMIIGSTTTEMIRSCKVPVLLMR